MELFKYKIFIAIGIFLVLSFALVKLTYKYFRNQSSVKAWKIGGLRAGYFRITLLVSLLLTGVLMLILKNTFLT